MRFNSHNTREKNKKTIFIALKPIARHFIDFARIKRVSLFMFTLVATVSFVAISTYVEARTPGIFRPTQDSINVFPSKISSQGWNNIETLGSQDVGEHSLFQSFNKQNSAYINQAEEAASEVIVDSKQTKTPETSDIPPILEDPQILVETPEDASTTVEVDEQEVDDIILETVAPTEVTPEPEAVVPIENTPSDTVLEEAAQQVEESPASIEASLHEKSPLVAFFKKVTDVFQFTQAATTTFIEDAVEEIAVEVEEPEVSIEIPEEEVLGITNQNDDIVIQTTSTPTSSPETASFEDLTQEVEEPTEVVFDGAHEPVASGAEEKSQSENTSSQVLTFSDFSVPELASGQFIDNMQLRLSLAGQYSAGASTTYPSLSVEYSFGEFHRDAGSILIEEEISNSINGGYYLIPLPSITNPSLLQDLTVTLTFNGDIGKLNALYIDSAWLEIGTVAYDHSLLENRFSPEQLRHLKVFEHMEFLSDKLDFTREEIPHFNFRYISQRNFIVKTFRSFFGRNLAEIERVKFLHNDGQFVGVTPAVNITPEGLVTVLLSDADKEKLKPGVYTVELAINEGGYVSTDSFEFQWGLLSINTNQTEYSNGDIVLVSMGALSQNGNTLCDANLNLYVTDPEGYISSAPVVQSGQCVGNNVVNVPDYSAQFPVDGVGEYEVLLESVDELGNVIAHTKDTFLVAPNQQIVIERNGPTRIFPPSPYPMELTVHALETSFVGEIIERVPNDFIILNTEAEIRNGDGYKELVWQVSMLAGTSEMVSYEFDAPDLSPYLYELGPASLVSAKEKDIENGVAGTQTRIEDSVDEDPVMYEEEEDVPDSIQPDQEVLEQILEFEPELETSEEVSTSSNASEVAPTATPVAPENSTVSMLFNRAKELFAFTQASIITANSSLESETANEVVSVVSEDGVEQVIEEQLIGTTTAAVGGVVFKEHRQWQIASDATGNMIIYWDNPTYIPSGWSCLSCGSGTFYRKFAVGSSTYNTTGGTVDHTHTGTGSVLADSVGVTDPSVSTAISAVSHSHSYTPTISTVSNLPQYRQLRVLQYTSSSGEPPSIPSGAIVMFDATVPSGWTRYSAQDNYFVYGEDTPGTTAGSNDDIHTITGTTGAAAGTNYKSQGPDAADGAVAGHTHTISSNTASISKAPPYISVIFGQADATTTLTNGAITMWTDEVPSGWIDKSSSPSDPFYNRFVVGSSTYGVTGGATTHTPADVSGITSSGPSGPDVTNARTGSGGSSITHTHTVNVTGFTTANNLPPYLTVIYGKRQGTNPVYDQLSYRWYANESSQTPTDPWPSGATDLEEAQPITSSYTTIKDGDVLRLRINSTVSNATSTAGETFQLQYAPADTCSAASEWFNVGAIGSTTALWRGYDVSLADHGTLSSTTLASTTVAETYEENGYASSTPNDINVDEVGEWDFVLQHNGAAASTNYCFRMVELDGTTFSGYTSYPQLLTNRAPGAPTLNKLFDNEKTASTSLVFQFVSSDAESEDLNYQIQIDDDYAFGSVLEDRNTISNSSQFENQANVSDKAPFTSGQLIEFTAGSTFINGTTYYWRARATDPNGSTEYGDWSEIYSFTIDTTLIASGWFQTTQEQFETDTLDGVETLGSDEVDLITGSTTGTITSDDIVFTEAIAGTAWANFTFNDTETAGDIKYTIEYLDDTATWTSIPDTDLAGNSAGFDTSPVNLLVLDVETYDTIRIVGTLTDSGGSPSLQDWAINWGYRVETPTITKLFPNEKTSTTTPVFEFSTTDPQNDSLTYEISWSSDNTFTSSTTRNSTTTPAGFNNIDNGGDTDPFISGDTIQYKVQSADVLTNNSTYWWRVRAKDTTGDNAWSFWTDPQSFTVDTTVTASTWFQTTQEQFDSNVLSGTIGLANDTVSVATTASEAILVYGEGTETAPRYRQWGGSAWGSEATMQDIGAPLQRAKVKAGTTREEYIAVTVGTDADVNAQVFTTGEWSSLQEMSTNVGSINTRGIDVTYETLSGDAMVAYCNNAADPEYRIWNGSTWSSATTINVTETTNCEWIQLASNPSLDSDEIVILVRGTDGNPYEAQVWDGDVWGDATTLGNITDSAHEGMSVAYEQGGDNQAVIVVSTGNQFRMTWSAWDGAAWSTAATFNLGDDFEWGTIVSDPGSDAMALCYQDEDTNIGYARWTGTTWAGQGELLTTTGKAKTDPGFSCVYEDDGTIVVAYTDTTQTNYSLYTGSWSSGVQLATLGDTITSELIRTGTGNVLGLFFDETNDDLLFSNWNGSSWSTESTIEGDASVDTTPFGRPYSLTPRNNGFAGTTIVSPGIDFDDGSGPYWDQFSWNETIAGTSEILYSVQYWDGDSWEFIPNIEIPGNDVGTTTGPIDLSGLNKTTYNLIRPYAALTCDGSGNCPQLQDWTVTWAEGITVSGTLQDYTHSTNINSGTVAVAVNGVLQTGKTGAIASGAWSIDNVTVFPGDIITVFVSDTADSSEAVGITRYDGIGNITGIPMYELHVSLGSDDATSTPLTNSDIAQFNSVNDEDIFLNISGSTLDLCTDVGCSESVLFIATTTRYLPGGNLVTHDIENIGTLTATSTVYVSGSWSNTGTTTLTDSTVVMTATSTTESIDTTGAVVGAFNNLTFGTTTGSASWTLTNTLDVNGNLTVTRGTLTRSTTAITVAGNLTTGANGSWSGVGTTTFDGSSPKAWSDANTTLQNVGNVVVDGANKAVTLGSDVLAQSLTIGVNDTLDVVTSYALTVYEDWVNNGTFLPRTGDVIFAATSTTFSIDDGGDGFYDLTFNGVGGAWAFINNTLSVGNDYTIATGTVTLPANGTTTIAGSFNNSGGDFSHSNSVVLFTSSGAETITANGDTFSNPFYDLKFNGGGSWSFTEAYATTTNDVIITAGAVTFPSDTLTIGGSLTNTAGSFSSNGGTVQMDSTGAETITSGGSSFSNLNIDGIGTFTILDTDVTLTADLSVLAGTLILPSGITTIGGSLTNSATLDTNSGEILFNSADSGETIDFGASDAYDITFNSQGGGWTIVTSATTTNNFELATSSDFTLDSGQTLAIGNSFTNNVGGASTTWTGSTLSLYGGTYTINDKTDEGDTYGTLDIISPAQISVWNSDASAYTVGSGAYLYSMDHADTDGNLYIWGDYVLASGNEYWSYATDFDGTDLSGGNERPSVVQFASGATANLSSSTLEILGDVTASSTISNQGSGTYTVSLDGGSVNAQYYEFADLGGAGFGILGGAAVTSLRDATYTVAGAGGSALTLSSTTIDANPGKQIYNVSFATTTVIAAYNVSQTDGTPSSYWWFRNSYGNIDGEAKDNDTGNPGSVRWDDSALVLTISGTIYSDDGTTLLGGATCDGDANEPVTVVVSGGNSYTGVCESDSTFNISGVTVIGDPTLTVYLNDADGGEKAVVVTKTPTADIADLNMYVNRVIVRHEDTEPASISDLAKSSLIGDTDIPFVAATGTIDTLTMQPNTELHVWHDKTFTPGGAVTLSANATANSYDGTLHLGQGATFTGVGTTTYTIGGSIILEDSATFVPASSTILMTATTTGKTITTVSTSSLAVHNLQFVGSGGGWNVNGNIVASDDIQVTTGTVTGTGDITLTNGSLYGNGLVSLGGGTTTIETTNTLGGTQGWTFYDLTLGNDSTIGTTTPASNATTTILNRLTIASAHFLDAGSSFWDLSGSGTVLVETGNFLQDTSTLTYSGTGATNILSTGYYNLHLSALAGAPTYTATGLGIQVFGDMQVGGASTTAVTFDTNDSALNVDGDFTITGNGTFIASDSGSFTIAGSYDNNGTFTAGGGTVTFDGAGVATIAAGNSSFATALLSGTGDYAVTEHATATTAFTINNTLSSFTLDSAQVLAVGGTFANGLGGSETTWTGSELSLYGGGNYEINAKTVDDIYETLTIADDTQIRMWNSDISSLNVNGGSLYSMDHANVAGDLYVYGTYSKTNSTDYWNYATDFDGTALGGSSRQVDVYVRTGGSIYYQGTSQLGVVGTAAASTTVQNQGTGTYSLTVGGSASTTMNYYDFQDMDSDGVTFTGSPNVVSLSYGSFLVANNADSAITVGGTALNSSPARTFTDNFFATSSGVTTAVNVTATGTSVSSWRFTNHAGDIDGENFNVDPDGDPGYIVWDDSAASISITGTVYDTDESSVSNVCPGATIRVRVGGLTTYDGACNASGVYSVTGVSYSPGDSIVAYIENETENGATITVDPGSNINNMDIYENRVIVRHESTNPITIDDLAVWDSSDDAADLDFTAVSGSPDTLTLAADTKLIVWENKEFEPGGDVTVPGGGAGAVYDGTVELQNGATYTANSGEEFIIGGSLISGAGASFAASTATTTFTTTGSARTVDTNDAELYNVNFTGSGSWTITNTTFGANNVLITAGTVTFPTGTTTVSGFFDTNGGTFDSSGAPIVFDGSGNALTVAFDGSDAGDLNFTGSGSWNMTDVNATSTGGLYITGGGTVSLPSGTLALSDSFRNVTGTVTHNTSEIIIATSTVATLFANGSDLYAVTFQGGGTFTMEDENMTLLDTLTIGSGDLTLVGGTATSTLSIGGSFNASGGTFDNATATILFNSSDAGETIHPGSSDFYNVMFGSASGGWTITADATTTNMFTLGSALNFTMQSGTRLYVGGTFDNDLASSATTWAGSTLELDLGIIYEINGKSVGDNYETLIIGANTDISAWNSQATTTIVDPTASFYSQDHASVDGSLYIYGDYHISTTTEWWSYATDFNGDNLALTSGERAVTVSVASGATTTVDGGTLHIVGTSGNETTITNQGSGQYAFAVNAGTFNAQYYAYRNLDSTGLDLSGTPVISALSYGDFELAVNGGSLINLSSTTLNANASLIITGNRFATTTAITGTNVYLTGDTSNAWTFVGHTGNLDGEDFDVDGATACGQVRWSDSSCLLTQQTHYRWRNDDGGLGVPDSEWYDSNWGKRKAVRVDNADATTYTDAVVEISVLYDTDMQADFDDLRFTDSTGTNIVPHFIASTTNTSAEVWVEVPSLPASDTATLFMYYDNPTATTTSSSTLTFIAADDFEDGGITEYIGANDDKALFGVTASFPYGNSSYGLDNTSNGNTGSRANDGGMARFDQSFSRSSSSLGVTIRYMQYIDTDEVVSGDDEVCTLFAVESPVSNNNNYAICTEQVPTSDYITLSKDIVDTDIFSGVSLASTTVVYQDDTWYEVEIDWETDGDMTVTLYDDNESQVAQIQATDNTYTTADGFGFTYWGNEGGWDNFSVRPLLITEPTIRFGAESVDGGASWAQAQDTQDDIAQNVTTRLRLTVENSGLAITSQNFDLEYADKGIAPSCESVSSGDYTTVPNQASCGSSPICMQTTANYLDGAATTDLLTGAAGEFVVGEAVESPSNTSGNIDIDQNYFTELEYAITATTNATSSAYCFKVTNSGAELDSYLKVAELALRFDPYFGAVSFNGGQNISLVGGTTTRVYATATVSDLNGYTDLVVGTSTMYTTSATAACTVDNNDCYITNTDSNCSFISCVGNSCTLSCYADFYYHADATLSDGGEFWQAFLEVKDAQGGTDFATSDSNDVTELGYLEAGNGIQYGALEVSSSTGSYNPTTTIQNYGNIPIDINVEGTNLSDGNSSEIPANYQLFATSTFDYTSCPLGTICTQLSTTTIVGYELDLSKPTTTSASVEDIIYWGIEIPFGVASNPHSGVNTFYAVTD